MKIALFAFALVFATAAQAQDPGQEPEKADPYTRTLEYKCTSDEGSAYKTDQNRKSYVFDIENKCDFRIRCKLDIAIFNSFGVTQAHRTLTIAPHTHQSITLKLKAVGGMNTHEHHCKQM